MRQRIAIIGASGFIGRALTKHLESRGYPVLALARRSSVRIPGARMLYGDIRDTRICKKIICSADVIYYLACDRSNIAHHLAEPYQYLEGNVSPLLSFLNALYSMRAAPRIIYLGSVEARYATRNEHLRDGYVLGKYVSELLLTAFASQTKKPITIVQAAFVYGPGSNFHPKTTNFIPAMIRKIHEAKSDITVWGTGKRKIHLMYINDIIRNLTMLLNVKHGTYTLGNPTPVSVVRVVRTIMNLMNKKLRITFDTSQPDRPSLPLDIRNVVAPRYTLRQGLQKTIAYYFDEIV